MKVMFDVIIMTIKSQQKRKKVKKTVLNFAVGTAGVVVEQGLLNFTWLAWHSVLVAHSSSHKIFTRRATQKPWDGELMHSS